MHRGALPTTSESKNPTDRGSKINNEENTDVSKHRDPLNNTRQEEEEDQHHCWSIRKLQYNTRYLAWRDSLAKQATHSAGWADNQCKEIHSQPIEPVSFHKPSPVLIPSTGYLPSKRNTTHSLKTIRGKSVNFLLVEKQSQESGFLSINLVSRIHLQDTKRGSSLKDIRKSMALTSKKHAPVAKRYSLRLIMAIAAAKDLEMTQLMF